MAKSQLELDAEDVAKAAAAWAHKESGGRTPDWDGFGLNGQHELVNAALAHMALAAALKAREG